MNLLDRVQSPADLRTMSPEELRPLAEELREFLIASCSVTGGHIGAGLGVVELTIALHAAFDTPRDQLVWDVGHQGYPHKMLTGRAEGRMHTLRQEDGISGFLKRSESEYDAFGAGHAATSISAALRDGRRRATCTGRTTRSSPSSATVPWAADWPTRRSTTPARPTATSSSC